MGVSGGDLLDGAVDRVFSLRGWEQLSQMVLTVWNIRCGECYAYQHPVPPVGLWPVWHRTELIRWLVRGRQRPGLLFRHVLAAAGDSARALLGAQDFGLAGFAAISLA